jgi:hypothetical protein
MNDLNAAIDYLSAEIAPDGDGWITEDHGKQWRVTESDMEALAEILTHADDMDREDEIGEWWRDHALDEYVEIEP